MGTVGHNNIAAKYYTPYYDTFLIHCVESIPFRIGDFRFLSFFFFQSRTRSLSVLFADNCTAMHGPGRHNNNNNITPITSITHNRPKTTTTTGISLYADCCHVPTHRETCDYFAPIFVTKGQEVNRPIFYYILDRYYVFFFSPVYIACIRHPIVTSFFSPNIDECVNV